MCASAQVAQTRPADAANNAITEPTPIMTPRSTPNVPAAATGPGVGGTNAWVATPPAGIAMMYLTYPFPVRRYADLANGISRKKTVSKKTGIERT